MSTRHRCPSCGINHDRPKASRVPRAILMGSVFAVVEVLAALRLDGWLGVALWLIVAWNIGLVAMLVWGTSLMATEWDG